MRLKPISTSNGGRHSGVLWALLCLFVLSLLPAIAQKKVKTAAKTDDRVYLVHSDELRYDQFGPVPDAQIVKGKVQFMHKGARMWCDSAYFYQQTNSFRAFGHVRTSFLRWSGTDDGGSSECLAQTSGANAQHR